MAYGNYFPVTYQPNYYNQPNPYYQQMQNQAMMQQNQQMQQAQQNQPVQQMQQPTIQQSGFVLVPSEQEARNYPVAPGNSVTFKDENAPYCYVKTMGFNQLDRPTFERYRLVKEDSPVTAQNAPKGADSAEGSKDTAYALKSDLGAIWSEIDALKEKVKAQAEKKPAKKKLIEVEAEDDED
jgi:hypothetical protein